MHDDTRLPEDDPDLKLARRLGTLLEVQRAPDLLPGGSPDPATDVPLAQALRALRARHATAVRTPDDASERIWARLAPHVEAPTRRPLRHLLRLPGIRPERRPVHPAQAFRWSAVAALLLVAAGLSWWLLRAPAPRLIAVAETTPVVYTTLDGSVVTLRPHSALYALSSGDGPRYRIEGEGFFEVVAQQSGTFAVAANEAVVSVLGTRFNVSTWGGQTSVYLAEGQVRFTHRPSGATVVLQPGEYSLVDPEGRLRPPAAAAADPFEDWLRDELVFTHQPLDRVLAELAQHYGITFDVPPALAAETLTGRIPLQDRAQSLGDLGLVLGGTFAPQGNGTYRFVPE